MEQSLPTISKPSCDVETRLPSKQCATVPRLIIRGRFLKLQWASWKSSRCEFQVLNNEKNKRALQLQVGGNWGPACTELNPKEGMQARLIAADYATEL